MGEYTFFFFPHWNTLVCFILSFLYRQLEQLVLYFTFIGKLPSSSVCSETLWAFKCLNKKFQNFAVVNVYFVFKILQMFLCQKRTKSKSKLSLRLTRAKDKLMESDSEKFRSKSIWVNWQCSDQESSILSELIVYFCK